MLEDSRISSYFTLEYHRTTGRVRFSCVIAMMLFIPIIQYPQRLFYSENFVYRVEQICIEQL